MTSPASWHAVLGNPQNATPRSHSLADATTVAGEPTYSHDARVHYNRLAASRLGSEAQPMVMDASSLRRQNESYFELSSSDEETQDTAPDTHVGVEHLGACGVAGNSGEVVNSCERDTLRIEDGQSAICKPEAAYDLASAGLAGLTPIGKPEAAYDLASSRPTSDILFTNSASSSDIEKSREHVSVGQSLPLDSLARKRTARAKGTDATFTPERHAGNFRKHLQPFTESVCETRKASTEGAIQRRSTLWQRGQPGTERMTKDQANNPLEDPTLWEENPLNGLSAIETAGKFGKDEQLSSTYVANYETHL